MKSGESLPISTEDVTWARRAHLSTFLTYVLTITPLFTLHEASFLTVLAPLLILILNRKSSYVVQQSLEAGYLQIILALLFQSLPWIFPYSGNEIQDGLFQAFRGLGYTGIGIFHLLSVVWATVSISYKKNYSHFLSPIKSFFSRRKEKIELEPGIDGATKQIYIETRNGLESQIQKFSTLSLKIIDPRIKAKCINIHTSILKLKETLEKKPSEFVNARHFFQYTMESLIMILEKYLELDSLKVKDKEVTASFQKMEPVLDTILEAIDKQHRKSLDSTVLQLDTEIEVMQKTMRMGGFG